MAGHGTESSHADSHGGGGSGGNLAETAKYVNPGKIITEVLKPIKASESLPAAAALMDESGTGIVRTIPSTFIGSMIESAMGGEGGGKPAEHH